jgi:hypothetical protein
MRVRLGLWFFVCAALVCAQGNEDPDVARAKSTIEKVRELVDAGAAPRTQLDKAEAALADAQDAAFLRRTLYGPELTEDQADEMIAVTERRLERRREEYAQAQAMVQAGVASRLSLGSYLEEIDRSRKENDLAVSRARLCHELTAMAKAEMDLEEKLAHAPPEEHSIYDRFEGDGSFTAAEFRNISLAFELRFGKSLPVSAMGETAVHRALGFDHRNRVDVAIHPDQAEGVWLRQYLTQNHIPFFAFRQAVPGKATGAHIHIGPSSTRITRVASGG